MSRADVVRAPVSRVPSVGCHESRPTATLASSAPSGGTAETSRSASPPKNAIAGTSVASESFAGPSRRASIPRAVTCSAVTSRYAMRVRTAAAATGSTVAKNGPASLMTTSTPARTASSDASSDTSTVAHLVSVPPMGA